LKTSPSTTLLTYLVLSKTRCGNTSTGNSWTLMDVANKNPLKPPRLFSAAVAGLGLLSG
jgi:hypothetical protein